MSEDLYSIGISQNKMFTQSQIAAFQTLFKDMNVCINNILINCFLILKFILISATS